MIDNGIERATSIDIQELRKAKIFYPKSQHKSQDIHKHKTLYTRTCHYGNKTKNEKKHSKRKHHQKQMTTKIPQQTTSHKPITNCQKIWPLLLTGLVLTTLKTLCINLNQDTLFFVKCLSTCLSKNLLYAIKYKGCNEDYICQT